MRLRISIPVMSGRLRSSSTSSACPLRALPVPSWPNRYFTADVPSVNGTISLLTPERRMFRSIRRAWPSSSSTMMMVTELVIAHIPELPVDRQRHREGAALIKFRGDRHGAAEPPHQRTDMCETNALAGLVLDAGTAEQIED